VANHHVRPHHVGERHGRPHLGQLGLRFGDPVDERLAVLDRDSDLALDGGGAAASYRRAGRYRVGQAAYQRVGHHAAGELATNVATHAVGDQQQPSACLGERRQLDRRHAGGLHDDGTHEISHDEVVLVGGPRVAQVGDPE
jgi:hypothetical protein